MHPAIAFATLFINPLFVNAQISGLVHTHFKKRCLPDIPRSGSLIEVSSPDLLTCSLLCQGELSCCSFFHKASSSTCFLQGDVLTHQPSQRCNGREVWYGKVEEKMCLERDNGQHEAQTKATIKHESTTGISQLGVLALFEHNENITLHQACMEGKLDEVNYILSKGLENINCRDEKGWTPVMAAAANGHEPVFYFLLRRGCDLSLVTNINNNVLHLACEGGNTDIVKELIDHQKSDIDSRGCAGWTPVMFAAHCGKGRVVDLLVRKGCNLNVVDDHKDNLLHIACIGGYVDIVKYILRLGIVSVESRGYQEKTPVLTAALHGHVDVVKLLVHNGCDTRVTDETKSNILHNACSNGHVDMVRYIIKHNIVEIDSRRIYGGTALSVTAVRGHKDVFDLLVSKGCNLTLLDAHKHNILHFASSGGNEDIVKWILTHSIVGFDSKDHTGQTPVMMATLMGHTAVFALLVIKGCNLKLVDVHKENILHLACAGGNVDIIKWILKLNIFGINSKNHKGQTPVMRAVVYGHVRAFDLLKMKGCNLKLVDVHKENILHLACAGGNVDIIKWILKHNIVGIDSKNHKGQTPVMMAVFNGHVRAFDLLKLKGCNLKLVDKAENNLLHAACGGGHIDMVQHIIDQNMFDIHSREAHGKTPLLTAAGCGHVGVVDLLKSRGCSLKERDDKKKNILHMSSERGHVNMVKYIIKRTTVDLDCRDKYGRTAVACAAENGHVGVVDLLALEGCSLTSIDNHNNTILHAVCASGNVDMVKYIISKHIAGIDVKGYHDRSPVMLAAQLGHIGVVRLLRKEGCDMKSVDDNGHNILHMACIGGHVNMVKYLIRLRIVSRRSTSKYGVTPIQVAKHYKHQKVVALLKAGK